MGEELVACSFNKLLSRGNVCLQAKKGMEALEIYHSATRDACTEQELVTLDANIALACAMESLYVDALEAVQRALDVAPGEVRLDKLKKQLLEEAARVESVAMNDKSDSQRTVDIVDEKKVKTEVVKEAAARKEVKEEVKENLKEVNVNNLKERGNSAFQAAQHHSTMNPTSKPTLDPHCRKGIFLSLSLSTLKLLMMP